MIFDDLGLPRDNGATDWQDSARLAGILAVFAYSQHSDLSLYILNGNYVRHPREHIYDFSRDQATCLIAGYGAKEQYDFVDIERIDGKDFLTPSFRGHVQRCKGLKANLFQNAWLWMDVLYSAHIKPLNEPNQLLCIMMLADPKYLKYWTAHNTQWMQSIRDYWSGWRGEGALAEYIILKVKQHSEISES